MKVIDKKNWTGGLDQLRKSYRLFAPVKEGQYHEFALLKNNELPDLQFSNTRLSPKSIVYPQSEVMFTYSLDPNDPDHDILKEAQKDMSQVAVLGIRPCDAASFLLVRKNFDSPDYQDPYWIRAYESTVFVGLACSAPCSTCFCTSAGSGPFHSDGLDVLLVDIGNAYLAKTITQKGEKLLQTAGWLTDADRSADDQFNNLKKNAESAITSHVRTDNLTKRTINELYQAPFWEDVSFACINCGTCTFVCPTCWCFDIQDETCGKCGVRMRNWDSCMFPLFTLHGSGHNPRGTKLHRVRQRFMHKLKYFVDKYNNGIQCVGCGRCVRLCPVNIDIRKVCDLMNSYDPASCACAIK